MTNELVPVRILIADDHALFREGLRMILDSGPRYQVVGEARNGKEAADLAAELKPDVLLLDLCMPEYSGMDALGLIRRKSLFVRSLILATDIKNSDVVEAFRAGASGVILKETTTEFLHAGIQTVISGDYWIGRMAVSELLHCPRGFQGPPAGLSAKKTWNLTPRERAVISEIATGKTNKEIAKSLGMSEQTVKHHLTSIFDKLGIYNRLELALFSVQHQLTEDINT